MKILYINPLFTCYRLQATLPGSEWQEYKPPYDPVVKHINADLVILESRSGVSKFPTCDPIGHDYREMISGKKLDGTDRSIGKGDELIFLSLSHLFRVLYEDCINRIEAIASTGASVRFWQENVLWDFENNREYAWAQFSMLRAMNSYVLYHEELAVEKSDHYKASWERRKDGPAGIIIPTNKP
jgi:hypothetical protein